MVKPILLTKLAVDAEPYLPWNAFVDVVSLNPYSQLTPIQRAAHLIFWYESEVQNGGHFQYFENQGTTRVPETIAALRQVGAHQQAQVLTEAVAVFQSKPRSPAQDVDESVEGALEAEYEQFDERFHSCPEELQAYLERYLEAHIPDFVVVA